MDSKIKTPSVGSADLLAARTFDGLCADMNTTERPPGLSVPHGSVLYRSAVSGLWYRNPRAAGEVDTVKVGPKARHLDLPDGAEIVTGTMRNGDLVANIYAPSWGPIDAEDVGLDAAIYDCVCRPSPNAGDVPRAAQKD